MRLFCTLVILNLLTIIRTKHFTKGHQHHDDATFRIAGGTEANIEDFPYMATLIQIITQNNHKSQRLLCSAVIIDRYFALSASSCFDELQLKIEDIVNGALIIRGNTGFWLGTTAGTMDHQIVNYHRHHNYPDRRTSMPGANLFFANLCVFKVKNPFTGANEKPIPLAPKDYVYKPRSQAIICGWGVTKGSPYTPSSQLRNSTVRLTNYERCKTFMHMVGDTTLLSNDMLCTFSHRNSICLYDSGGPLVQNGLLIGIASFADENTCIYYNYFPDVYTRISEVNEWIVKYMKLL